MTAAFSLKKMDEEEAWRSNYQFIAQHYPNLKKKSFDFYLQKVNVLAGQMSADDRETFAVQYHHLRQIMKRNFWYVVFGSKLKLKPRMKLVLDILKY